MFACSGLNAVTVAVTITVTVINVPLSSVTVINGPLSTVIHVPLSPK